MTVIRLLHKFLTHPMTIIVGVVLGFVVGFRFPEFPPPGPRRDLP